MIVGWGWNDGGYSPGSGVGRSEGYSGGATHHFEDEGFRVRQIGQVIQRWKTSAAHHVVELGLHLLLDQRLADGEDHGPLQRRFDRLTAGTEHVTDDLLHLTICAPKFQHVIDSGFNWWLFFFIIMGGWKSIHLHLCRRRDCLDDPPLWRSGSRGCTSRWRRGCCWRRTSIYGSRRSPDKSCWSRSSSISNKTMDEYRNLPELLAGSGLTARILL